MKCLWRSARQIQFQWFLLYLVCRLIVFWMFDALQVLYVQAGAPYLCGGPWPNEHLLWLVLMKNGAAATENRDGRKYKTQHVFQYCRLFYITAKIFHPSSGSVWYPCLYYPLSWAIERCFGGQKWLLSFLHSLNVQLSPRKYLPIHFNKNVLYGEITQCLKSKVGALGLACLGCLTVMNPTDHFWISVFWVKITSSSLP